MYEGYPDFQRIIICDDQRFVAAYRQNDAYYLYPQALSILAADPLAFSLDIVRSYSTESLYGWLNFTTQLQFAGEQSLQVFKQQYPDCAVKALPVLPGSLGFDVPIDYHSELYGRHYDTTWYSAQCSQFIILLNAASTQLIERTLLDETIGFNARLDGFVEGVSPRLAYRVEFDARALILALAAGVEGAHAVGDTGIVFPYDGLTLYLSRNLTRLPLDIDPPPPANDPAGDLLLSQALLDRLYNLYGAPSAGPAAGNVAQILLTPPPHAGRTRCDLANVALTQRPLCFTLIRSPPRSRSPKFRPIPLSIAPPHRCCRRRARDQCLLRLPAGVAIRRYDRYSAERTARQYLPDRANANAGAAPRPHLVNLQVSQQRAGCTAVFLPDPRELPARRRLPHVARRTTSLRRG